MEENASKWIAKDLTTLSVKFWCPKHKYQIEGSSLINLLLPKTDIYSLSSFFLLLNSKSYLFEFD